MNDLTLFISSSDKYQDCWMPFFTLFERKWSNCVYDIILNTEQCNYTSNNLKITCTNVGRYKHFGETFHAGLNQVKTKYVLLIMIDYFIMDVVNNEMLEDLFEKFKTLDLDGMYLVNQDESLKGTLTEAKGIYCADKISRDRFSFQIGIWKKDILSQYVLKHEDPWMAEKFGTLRANVLNHRIGFVSKDAEPIKYLLTGGLHKGGWIPQMKDFFDREEIEIDYSKRGFYKKMQPDFFAKLIAKKNRSWGEFKSWLQLKKLVKK